MTTFEAPDTLGTPSPIRHRWVETAVGRYLLAATDDALVGVWRQDQARFPRPERYGDPADGASALLDRAEEQLHGYLAGDREDFDLPLAPAGTAFQQRVWARLREIPRGSTTTYGDIARELDAPRAAQAVGAAVGANPLSIVVPCHRVLAGSGALTGYAGGIDTKRRLLVLERALPA